jgi:single-stranded-DNA-specific exonuclease
VQASVAPSPAMSALRPRYRWLLRSGAPPDAALLEAARRHALSDRLVELLAARDHAASDLAALLGPPERALHDPALLPDADALRVRIAEAQARRDGILVFGDFDADGLTGLAILTLALRRLGLDVEPYVPSRADEGHGLSVRAVERALADGRRLIVTVDCGVSSAAEIALAADAGVDVIVTDHHHVPAELPPAVAVVDPHRPDSRYPDSRLAGSGVAFKVAQLLLREEPDGPEAALELAELAVIGTVADVAPVLGENRAIARLGLARLRESPRPGIAALLRSARLDPARVDLETVAFALAPRLNAVGRVGEALAAARLLLTEDPAEAEQLAAELEQANLARRELMQAALVDARVAAERDADAPAVVVAGDWPIGVIGLVAGRLAEERGRPAVVFATGALPWRGSARSAGGFDLAGSFEQLSDLFDRFGGHAQAAGCSLREGSLAIFTSRFMALASSLPAPDPTPILLLDLALTAPEVDYRLHRELLTLEPTGPGHPTPLVGVAGLVVTRVRPTTGDHTQLTLRKGIEVLDGIAFERGDLAESLSEGDELDVVARLASRTFGGYESLQLELRDVGPAGTLAEMRSTAAAAASAAAAAADAA